MTDDKDRKRDRQQALDDYVAGKPVAFLLNPKGLYELYSQNGTELRCFDYTVLRKSRWHINKKPVLFWNVHQYTPYNEHGHPSSQLMDRLRRLLQVMLKRGDFKDYEVIYLGHDKDMKEIDLTGYAQEFTQTIYDMLGRPGSWTFKYRKDDYFAMWGGCMMARIKKAVSLLKHLKKNTGVNSGFISLESIQNEVKGRWAVVNAVVKYWIHNGMKFTDDDDRFAKGASIPIRGAYMALGGKSPCIKDVNKEAGIVLMRVLSPGCPLDEVPLYISTKDKHALEAVKERLARGH